MVCPCSSQWICLIVVQIDYSACFAKLELSKLQALKVGYFLFAAAAAAAATVNFYLCLRYVLPDLPTAC